MTADGRIDTHTGKVVEILEDSSVRVLLVKVGAARSSERGPHTANEKNQGEIRYGEYKINEICIAGAQPLQARCTLSGWMPDMCDQVDARHV